MLTIKKLTKAHAGRTLFRETEMTINWGERVALVGPNGAGKSTLFRMILREDTPDEGSISLDEYAIVGYLPQEASEPKDETVLEIAMGITPEMERAIHVIRMSENANKTDTPEYAEAIDTFNAANGYQLEPKAKKILKGLAFRESDFHRPAREMSGGWIMRAYLAKLLVLEPDLLMLDEPTNHLDLLSLLWLQRYLKNYPGAILMISHDRDFMDELVESIRVHGILSPLLARPKGEGYELVSGHRRRLAAQKLGLSTVPVLVREMTDDEAVILMVDSNLQRENLLPSEKAFAYKMKLEAMKHQGKSTSCKVCTKSRTDEMIGKHESVSARTIQNYIRLTNLVPPLLQLVDDGRIAFSPAVELSYLTRDEQAELWNLIGQEDATPSLSQALRMKQLSREAKLTPEVLYLSLIHI